jgi:hypothetical protein
VCRWALRYNSSAHETPKMTKPIVRDSIYRRRRFDAEIIELCVRWYITYRLSNGTPLPLLESTDQVGNSSTIRLQSKVPGSFNKAHFDSLEVLFIGNRARHPEHKITFPPND